jgi:GMP synthase-like glutamine amidotransferase
MKVHVLQHVPFEGLGSIDAWLAAAGAETTYTRFYQDWVLPDPREQDLLVAMGGPMSVRDEGAHAWLRPEKHFLREAILAGTPVLGVCLGAQLIASALGARVYPNPHREIGWFPVEAVAAVAGRDIFRLPPRLSAFHWHGETFDLPAGAVRLARSGGCENQAFQVGHTVLGFQFHLETTPDSADQLLEHNRAELAEGPYMQSEQAMRAVPASAYTAINRLMGDALDYVTRRRRDGSSTLSPA